MKEEIKYTISVCKVIAIGKKGIDIFDVTVSKITPSITR
jgi:hypothetical protein